MTSTEKLVKTPERRVRRSPVTGKNILTVKGKDPNFVYRIVNNVDDRVYDMQERGYEIDTSEDIRVGDSRIETTSKLGTVREVPVGQGTKAVVMRQRKDWYDEDQALKQAEVKKSENAMRQSNPNEGTYGKIDIVRGPLK